MIRLKRFCILQAGFMLTKIITSLLDVLQGNYKTKKPASRVRAADDDSKIAQQFIAGITRITPFSLVRKADG
jgi:hypothetical protein